MRWVSSSDGHQNKVKGVNKLMAGQLIFAFPAVGKSTFKRNHKNVIDMELSDVKYDNTGLEHLTHEERKMMPRPLLNENYKDEFKKVQGYLNSGQDVLVGLCYLPHFLVKYPKLVKSSKIFIPKCTLKQEYLSRYRTRGNNKYFVKRMGKWFVPTTLIFGTLGIFFKQITIVKSGKYLSDYL